MNICMSVSLQLDSQKLFLVLFYKSFLPLNVHINTVYNYIIRYHGKYLGRNHLYVLIKKQQHHIFVEKSDFLSLSVLLICDHHYNGFCNG